MISGILILESGEVQIIGELKTMRGIVQAINSTVIELIATERKQLLATITEDELKTLIEKKVTKDKEKVQE